MNTARQTQLTAILTMVAVMAGLPTLDTLSKKLMLSVTPVIIIWTRYTMQTVLVSATIWRRQSPELWRTREWQLLPDAPALCGMSMIAGFGLATGWLNKRKAKA
jgi:hypothetical protein